MIKKLSFTFSADGCFRRCLQIVPDSVSLETPDLVSQEIPDSVLLKLRPVNRGTLLGVGKGSSPTRIFLLLNTTEYLLLYCMTD